MEDASGLSVLELVITLGLTAVLAGFSILGHHALRPGLNLTIATRQVLMDLQVARMRAVAHNADQRIVFASGGTSYRLQRRNGSKYDDEGQPVELPAGIIVRDCTAATSAISFRPRGTAGTFGTLTLQNSQGDIRRVVVDIAGHVRVQ
jgi:Tfp pilus assembly protein FimT